MSGKDRRCERLHMRLLLYLLRRGLFVNELEF